MARAIVWYVSLTILFSLWGGGASQGKDPALVVRFEVRCLPHVGYNVSTRPLVMRAREGSPCFLRSIATRDRRGFTFRIVPHVQNDREGKVQMELMEASSRSTEQILAGMEGWTQTSRVQPAVEIRIQGLEVEAAPTPTL